MLPYWLLYMLTAIPAIGARGQVQQRHSIWGPLVLATCIALLIGLRFEVGADWLNYIYIFQNISYLDLSEAVTATDAAFGIVNWVVSQLGLEYWAVNLICGSIFTVGLFTFCFRLPNPWLAIAVATPYLILVVAMGYSRQGVALGCMLLGLVALARHSLIRALMWIILAAAFHKSAVVVIPIVGLAYTRNRLLVVALSAALGLAAYYLFVASELGYLIATYAENELESRGAAVRLLMNVPPALIFLATMQRFGLEEAERRMWRNFSLLALASIPLFFVLPSSTMLDRLALYILPLQVFVWAWLPTIFSLKGRPNSQLVIAILIYSALVQFVWLNYGGHSEAWIPYQIYPLLD